MFPDVKGGIIWASKIEEAANDRRNVVLVEMGLERELLGRKRGAVKKMYLTPAILPNRITSTKKSWRRAYVENFMDFKNCPHCNTEGVLVMSDGRCPNCKRVLAEVSTNLSSPKEAKSDSINVEFDAFGIPITRQTRHQDVKKQTYSRFRNINLRFTRIDTSVIFWFLLWIGCQVVYWWGCFHFGCQRLPMILILIILFPIMVGFSFLLGIYAAPKYKTVDIDKANSMIIYPISIVVMAQLFGGWTQTLRLFDEQVLSTFWPDKLSTIGLTREDAICYTGHSYAANPALEERYLAGYLAVTHSAAKFTINKVLGPGNWPFSSSLVTNVKTMPQKWGDIISISSGSPGREPKTFKNVRVEVEIKIPSGDINEPCKLFGRVESIQVIFPMLLGNGKFRDQFGEANSQNLEFWVLPNSMIQMVNTAVSMENRIGFNFFLFLIVFTIVYLASAWIFIHPYGKAS